MTCIAVKVKKDKIEVACDKQVSWGGNKMPMAENSDKQLKSMGKIFQTNGMTIGGCGSLADLSLLSIYAKTHKPKDMNRDDILEWFIEFINWYENKTGDKKTNLSFVIINDGFAFIVHDFYEVYQIEDFDAIGSGMWLALGVLDNGGDVIDAIKTAIKYDLYCGGDVNKITIKI